MKKNISVFAFISVMLFILVCRPLSASACSCASPPSVEDSFARAQVVFSGEVLAIKKNVNSSQSYGKTVRFKVKETWKGINETEVVVATGNGGGDCGFSFVIGEKYLVYAQVNNMYGETLLANTTICDRTTEFSNATEDVGIIGQGQAPTNEVKLDETSKPNYLFIGGIVFVAGVLVLFALYRFKKKK